MAVADTQQILYEFFTASITGASLGTLDSNIDDDGTSIELAVGYTPLERGTRIIKIDDEFIPVTGILSTLSVIEQGRGFFGSTPVLHSAGATVTRASFSDIVGTEISPRRMDEEFDNLSPGMEFRIIGRSGNTTKELRKPRVQIKIYGGSDRYGKMRDIAPNLLFMLLLERCQLTHAVPPQGNSVDSGFIVSSEADDNEGQDLIDSSMTPDWPLMIAFIDFEVRLR